MKKAWFCLFIVFLFVLSVGAVAAEEKPIKIGLQAPITGQWAYEGEMAKNSVEVALQMIQEQGGILGGRKIEIVVADDASNPRDSALAAQRLVSQRVAAVIGTYGSSVNEPAADIYEASKMIDIGYGSTAVKLTMAKERKYFFRTCGRDDTQGQFFSEYAVGTMKARRIAIMHDNTTFALGVAELVFYDAITPGEKDFTPILTKLRETNPDVWYFTGYFPEAGLLVRQGRELGIKCPFVGGNAAINEDFVKIAGIEYAKGCLMTQEPMPTDLDTPKAKRFLELYRQKHNTLPTSPWPVYAADALIALSWAIDKAGSTDTEAMLEVLRTGMEGCEGITGSIAFTERGDRKGIIYKMYVVTEGGDMVVYQP